ncbi:MAG: M14 family metallopeptidase [Rhodovibrionaceae bacterium]
MTAAQYFPASYDEGRANFRAAAQAEGFQTQAYANPTKGPQGQELTTDVCWIGPRDAERVLVAMSATHGNEGYCGSGVQNAWLREGLYKEMPEGTAQLLIHAVNPSGFAWVRRVTEENVDMNRNFVDFTGQLPENSGYQDLHPFICPRNWDDATLAECDRVFDAYVEENGLAALQHAISGGQYSHSDGLFFGGQGPTNARKTLLRIIEDYLGQAKKVAVVDYHTGLGPYGHGERIVVHDPKSPAFQRAREWYDDDITSPFDGSSTSAPLTGVNLMGMEEALGDTEFTALALEYGTYELMEVLNCLRADNWLHQHGDLDSEKGKAIKKETRRCLYPDKDDWKEMIWERAVETQRAALRGLTQG